MGRSLSTPGDEPDGRFIHKASGATVSIYRQDGAMRHKIEERGLTADYPIAYGIGFGSVGRSYLIELGGHFFQSPAAFYTARREWDASPGYEGERVLDFTRAITSDCLVCHVGGVITTTLGRASKTMLTPISCERCHGDAAGHLKNPVPGTIVNPAKLAIRERDSVCEQCHLESATVVLNPNKYWWDFRPGERLEQVEAHYIYKTTGSALPSIGAVSQAEELALSACARGSGGKLWCGSCHDPHGAPADRKRQIREVCEGCHAPAQVASIHKTPQEECVSCHMPRRQAVDVSHAAITDHRIMKRWSDVYNGSWEKTLVAWHDPEPGLGSRDLGLAYFNVAKREGSAKDFEKAFAILSALPGGRADAAVSAAVGYMLLGTGRAGAAVERFQQATEEQPGSAEYWLDLGVAQNAAGQGALAVESFRRSIQENPYDYRPYQALSDLYKSQKQPIQSQEAIDQFLRLAPQNVSLRLPR
jgi:predicted CXXCH cytochrome family protein